MAARTPRYFHGTALLVAILREAPAPWRAEWLAKIRVLSPILARLYEEFDFIYRDIARIDARGAQLCLRLISEKDLLVAWKLTGDDVKEVLLRNMSDRRREEFLTAFKAQGRVPRRQVFQVQRTIARQVRQWLMEGKAGLASRRDAP